MKTNPDIYKLKLHECATIYVGYSEWYTVMRVPGGWLYLYCNNTTTIFVPFSTDFSQFSTEFQEKE